MLSNQHFYHRTIRRNVVVFGTIFKDITLVRYAKDTFDEIDRITVPLAYGYKDPLLKRILGNPSLNDPLQILLPKMSFRLVGINYDSSRKVSSFTTNYASVPGTNSSVYQQYAGTPYDLDFELYIYVRNVEDGTQIVEQILPYFNPDYTLSMSFVDDMNIVRDVPIILESVVQDIQNDGLEGTTRVIVWTLGFKMKTYFFGPVSTAKIITKATANTYLYTTSSNDIVELNVNSGTGDYRSGEVIYVGDNLQTASATAEVLSWNANNRIIKVTNSTGMFTANANVKGIVTGTSRKISSILPVSQQMMYYSVVPNPTTANATDDFGYTETIYEQPNIP